MLLSVSEAEASRSHSARRVRGLMTAVMPTNVREVQPTTIYNTYQLRPTHFNLTLGAEQTGKSILRARKSSLLIMNLNTHISCNINK